MSDYKPVVFTNSEGEEVSNDPVWLAQKTLEAAGIEQGLPFNPRSSQPDYDEPLLDTSAYKDLKGPELKKLAAERDVDISGLKTVGEVREALAAADAAAEQGVDSGAADDNES